MRRRGEGGKGERRGVSANEEEGMKRAMGSVKGGGGTKGPGERAGLWEEDK